MASLAVTIIGGFLGIVLIAFFVSIYNSLVLLHRNIDKAWANINVLLKQRRDEIPKLVETVKQYKKYEKSTLEELTRARTKASKARSPDSKSEAESRLGLALGRFFAVAEDYPELQADDNFRQLQSRISKLEDNIADRREFYNDSVNTYNIRIHQIPYNFVAGLLGYKEKELFQVATADTKDVNMKKMFRD